MNCPFRKKCKHTKVKKYKQMIYPFAGAALGAMTGTFLKDVLEKDKDEPSE